MFNKKTLLITGGTDSFGNAILNRFLDSDIDEIRIFSRDEKKQDDMRGKLKSNKLKLYIGDVRDKKSVDSEMFGVDYVFYAAALESPKIGSEIAGIVGNKSVVVLDVKKKIKWAEEKLGAYLLKPRKEHNIYGSGAHFYTALKRIYASIMPARVK